MQISMIFDSLGWRAEICERSQSKHSIEKRPTRRTDSCRNSVSHLAGYYPPKFTKLQRIHPPGVSDIPIGTFVLVLRQDANDKGWAPAVVNETLDGRTYARFT